MKKIILHCCNTEYGFCKGIKDSNQWVLYKSKVQKGGKQHEYYGLCMPHTCAITKKIKE